jgi:hypothetical protein
MKKSAALGGVLLASIGAGGVASAQNTQSVGSSFLASEVPLDVSRGRNVSVVERPRPDYEALGIRLNSFTLYPRVRLSGGYSSNVYGQENGTTGDAFAGVDPSLYINSNWSRNSLAIDVGGAFRRFASETPKNENGLNASAIGRFDLGSSYIQATGRVRRAYESQYSGAFPVNAAESVQYVASTGELRGVYQGGRIRLLAIGDVNRFTFRNSRALDGSIIAQNTRDRTVARGSARAEFAATPDTAAFVQYTYADSSYDSTTAIGGLGNRDSKESRILAGVTFDLTELIRGSAGVGYVDRRYSSPAYGSISGLSADVRIEYFITQLTTITLTGRRLIEDAVTTGSGGFFANTIGLRADHELLRNLLVNLHGTYERDVFKDISRRDRYYNLGLGADFFANRRVGISGGVDYLDRGSTGVPLGLRFDELRGSVSLLYQI